MKKFISLIFAIIVMAGVASVISSCNKDGNNTDYYSFSWSGHENSKCNFDAISSLYDGKYHNWKGQCSTMSPSQAKAKWAEAEAEFKSVESKLYADSDCYFEIKMQRYSIVNNAYTPVETIGIWRFPATLR